MESGRYLDHLAADGEALVRALEADPDAAVAACPGWDVAGLARHTGGIHRWAAEMVRTGTTTRLSRRDMADQPPTDLDGLIPWCRESLGRLVDTLAMTDPDTPVWTFGPEQKVRFWQRRMAHETAVHRWDADAAAGTAQPIDGDLAGDGIDEVITVFLAGLTPPARLHLDGIDVAGRWTVHGEGAEVSISGAASDLLLFLWGRVPPDGLADAGDLDLLRRWQDAVRI